MSAPIAIIIRSVWSRDSDGCLTVVEPSACIPASRTHDLTCALDSAGSWTIPWSPPPRMASGARESSMRPVTSAPISTRGVTIRPIGLDLRDRSPLMTLKNDWAARRPAVSRRVVPLLPAFSTPDRLIESGRAAPVDLEALGRSGDFAVGVPDDARPQAPEAPQH